MLKGSNTMKRNSNSEITFDLQDSDELIDALKSLTSETEIGKKYKAEYYTRESGNEHTDLILNAVDLLFPSNDGHTVRQLSVALHNLILAGQIQPKDKEVEEPLESPTVDLTPRDKNGRALTQAQLVWSEMTRFANDSSMDAIRQRKNIDPKFRSFMATNLTREMQEQPVGDGVTNLNANKERQNHGEVREDVKAFAIRYRTMSAADVKKLLSPGMNPDGAEAAAKANWLFNEACRDGLI
jgi:hypothetical protein